MFRVRYTTAETLKKLLEVFLSSSCPKLSSLAIVMANHEHLLAVTPLLTQPNAPYLLDKLSFIEIDSAIAANAVGDIVTSQCQLSTLKITCSRYSTWDMATCSKITSSLESFLQQPHLKHFSIQIHNNYGKFSTKVFQKMILLYLTSPCSHEQTVEIDILGFDGSFTSLSEASQKLNVSELALQYKSLEISVNFESSREVDPYHWLLNLQPLKLKSLLIGRSHQNCLTLAANNPSLYVSNLNFSTTCFSAEAFLTILQNKTLRSLKLLLCNKVNLNDVTTGLLKQKEMGTLETLKFINSKHSYTGYVELPHACEVQQFSDALFSLPQVSRFSLEIGTLIHKPFDAADIIKEVFRSWKKNNECRLMEFVLCFRYRYQGVKFDLLTLDKQSKTFASDMGIELKCEPIYC